ncbi:unnamed protein product [Lactuca virosa]|uniref:Reverse transcriptase domain-containing protein n=1 Tax=Lactuca virosa TaxID=75947 RepID=A0AAU9M7U6_9ASTR|nr:unnamed protein product [Lactuca virosa]
MANGKTESTGEIYLGCTLTLNHHAFQINLMLVTIRSFDVIIGMDWLSPHHAEIMCHEKAVRLHLPNHETLIIYGAKPSTNLRLISCIKAHKCLQKKDFAFLAHIVDKSKEEINIRYIPVACDFPDIFPEDLPGIPPESNSSSESTL